MKFLGLVAPKDEKAVYRQVAEETKQGAALAEVKHGQVELFPESLSPAGQFQEPNPITKEEISKLANKLRNGLREFGRFTVTVEGNIAEVSVSNRAVRVVKKKVVTLPDTPKAPAVGKKAAAK